MKREQEPKYDAIVVDGAGEPKELPPGWRTVLINRKTGEVIQDAEPVFIFRGRDRKALATLTHYSAIVEDTEHERVVLSRCEDFNKYARFNRPQMKEPDS